MAPVDTTVHITTVAQLLAWNGTGTAYLENSITITSSDAPSFPINIGSASAVSFFKGKRFTISIDSDVTNFGGLFKPITNAQTISIQKTKINMVTSSSLSDGCGAFISSTNAAYGGSTVTGFTVSISNCAVTGTYTIPIDAGALIGRFGGSSTCSVTGCYSTGAISSLRSGGIIGRCSTMINVTITNCYSTGDITGKMSGGIVGSHFGYSYTGSGTNASISNCYSTGTINYYSATMSLTEGSAGGITGGVTTGNVTISNCYSSGTLTSGGGICGYTSTDDGDSDNITISNCYSKSATGTGTGDKKFIGSNNLASLNITNSNAGSGTWDATLGTDLLNNSTWDNASTPFKLTYFEADPWDSITYGSAADTDIGYAAGDPHINPLCGNSYNLDLLGAFKLFDNNNKNRLIINGFSDYGKYHHNKLTYIRQIFIYHDGKTMMINTGFRGERASIISNIGFNKNDIEIRDLVMGNKIIRKCQLVDCNFVTKKSVNTRHNSGTGSNDHYIPELVRNQITINIRVENDNDYKIIIRNVNSMNVHPCQIQIIPTNMEKISNYSGAIVRESLVAEVKLHKLEHTEYIKLNMY